MVGSTDECTKSNYFELFSRGGLTTPFMQITEFVNSSFPILDFADKFIDMHMNENTRRVAELIMKFKTLKSVMKLLLSKTGRV